MSAASTSADVLFSEDPGVTEMITEPLIDKRYPWGGTYLSWCPTGNELSFLDRSADPKKWLSVPCTYDTDTDGEIFLLPTEEALVPESRFTCPASVLHLNKKGMGFFWTGVARGGLTFTDPPSGYPEKLANYKLSADLKQRLQLPDATAAGVSGRLAIRLPPRAIGATNAYSDRFRRAPITNPSCLGDYPDGYMPMDCSILMDGAVDKEKNWPAELRWPYDKDLVSNIPTLLTADGQAGHSIPLVTIDHWGSAEALLTDLQRRGTKNLERIARRTPRYFQARLSWQIPTKVQDMIRTSDDQMLSPSQSSHSLRTFLSMHDYVLVFTRDETSNDECNCVR